MEKVNKTRFWVLSSRNEIVKTDRSSIYQNILTSIHNHCHLFKKVNLWTNIHHFWRLQINSFGNHVDAHRISQNRRVTTVLGIKVSSTKLARLVWPNSWSHVPESLCDIQNSLFLQQTSRLALWGGNNVLRKPSIEMPKQWSNFKDTISQIDKIENTGETKKESIVEYSRDTWRGMPADAWCSIWFMHKWEFQNWHHQNY